MNRCVMTELDLSLYLVTDSSLLPVGATLEFVVEEAIKGGVTIVQLREKSLSYDEFVARARSLKRITDKYSVALIINDDVDVALAVDAAGVHIGQSDRPYSEVRERLGGHKIVGLSVESFEQAQAANEFDVDYIAISPIFDTATKSDISQPLGIEGGSRIVAVSRHPVVAIGGINIGNIPQVMGCGVDGVALVSAIICAEQPEQAARVLYERVEQSRPLWSDNVWHLSSGLVQRIKHQSFNVEMMNGGLDESIFRRYIEQDIIYIANYSEEMQLIAKMLPDAVAKREFENFAREGMAAERELHEMLSQRWSDANLSCDSSETKIPPSQVTAEYIAHTRQWVDAEELELSMAAILPCLWVYGDIGRYLYDNSELENNRYRAWIETYSSELMQSGVKMSIDLANALAQSTSAKYRAAMRYAFIKSVWYEWAFWEWAYRVGEYKFENEIFKSDEI